MPRGGGHLHVTKNKIDIEGAHAGIHARVQGTVKDGDHFEMVRHGVVRERERDMTGVVYRCCCMLCGMAAFSSFGAMAQQNPGGAGSKWNPYVDVEAKAGSKRNIGEADLFMPLSQDARTLVFGNLRLRLDNQTSYEGNLGIGMRRMLESGWNLGAYGYWDHRRSTTGNFFDQATLGVEALGRDWDFRANGYLPMGTKVRDLSPSSSAAVSGASVQITTTTREERALPGFDAELGWRAPIFDSEASRQLRLYVGGYRFSNAGLRVEGPRLRAELAIDELSWLGRGTRLFLNAESQHDNVRGGQSYLGIRLRIPLEREAAPSRSLMAQERRMTAPVVRDVDIVSHSRVSSTLVETATATSGQAITVLDSGTTATAAALNTALATAGATTVILSGTFNTNAQVNMAAGQTLIGGGSLAVRSASGRTATLSLPGATIAATGNSTVVALAMANNAALIGMTVTNGYSAGSSNAVSVQSLTGVTIRNSTLTANGTNGAYTLDANAAVNAVIVGNTITANPSAAAAIGIRAAAANNITIADNTIATEITPSASKYAIAGTNTTVFAAGSTGNVAVGGTCLFVGGAPTGSAGFSTITCP
jgi:hypothetical protein